MADAVVIRRGLYRDSVALMQLTNDIRGLDGVDNALVAAATELNVELLADLGFSLPDDTGVRPDDLLIAVSAGDEAACDRAVAAVDDALTAAGPGSARLTAESVLPHTLGRTVKESGAGLALVSVPGEFAFAEAIDALRSGANVMIFSDGVSIEHELALKREAADLDRLVMGPDCGTAIVGGLGLGFANVVRSGDISIVAASGTGAQHLSTLLDGAGLGVRHILGVGGRDTSSEVGGLSTLQAIRALDQDPATELIVVVSKVPGPEVGAAIDRVATSAETPVVVGLLGPGGRDLTELAAAVADRIGSTFPPPMTWLAERRVADPAQRLVGLFAGGTLAQEAEMLAAGRLGKVGSLAELEDAAGPSAIADQRGHLIVDFGADRMTRGRPHPMIDQTLRLETLKHLGESDGRDAVLLDVVLGHGAHPDPAAELAPAIAALVGRSLGAVTVAVSLIGTGNDPQGLGSQAKRLSEAGADVYASNAEAARRAIDAVGEVP